MPELPERNIHHGWGESSQVGAYNGSVEWGNVMNSHTGGGFPPGPEPDNLHLHLGHGITSAGERAFDLQGQGQGNPNSGPGELAVGRVRPGTTGTIRRDSNGDINRNNNARQQQQQQVDPIQAMKENQRQKRENQKNNRPGTAPGPGPRKGILKHANTIMPGETPNSPDPKARNSMNRSGIPNPNLDIDQMVEKQQTKKGST